MERIATTEAAAIIGCSTSHVRQLVKDGELHPYRPSPRVLLFDRREVERYARKTFSRGWPRGKPRKAAEDAPEGEGDGDA